MSGSRHADDGERQPTLGVLETADRLEQMAALALVENPATADTGHLFDAVTHLRRQHRRLQQVAATLEAMACRR